MSDFYVDDRVTSIDSTEHAIQFACEARELRLHMFVSNDRAVLESIPPSERASDIKDRNLAFDDLPSEKSTRDSVAR